MTEYEKLELIMHLAHCEPCRSSAFRRYRAKHLLIKKPAPKFLRRLRAGRA